MRFGHHHLGVCETSRDLGTAILDSRNTIKDGSAHRSWGKKCLHGAVTLIHLGATAFLHSSYVFYGRNHKLAANHMVPLFVNMSLTLSIGVSKEHSGHTAKPIMRLMLT